MKVNPCRYCALSVEFKGKHHPSWKKECGGCDNLKKHKEYLQSQRMFEKGEQITDISELLKEEWLIFGEMTKHIEAFKSMPLRIVIDFINRGVIYKAVRKEDCVENRSD